MPVTLEGTTYYTVEEFNAETAKARRESEQAAAAAKGELATLQSQLTALHEKAKQADSTQATLVASLQQKIADLEGQSTAQQKRQLTLEALVEQGSLTMKQAKFLADHPTYSAVDFTNEEQAKTALSGLQDLFPAMFAKPAANGQPAGTTPGTDPTATPAPAAAASPSTTPVQVPTPAPAVVPALGGGGSPAPAATTMTAEEAAKDPATYRKWRAEQGR